MLYNPYSMELTKQEVAERRQKRDEQDARQHQKALAYDNMINHSKTKEQRALYEAIWRSL